MLTESQNQSFFTESSHRNQATFVFVLLDDLHHTLKHVVLQTEVEHFVAVGVIEDHLVDVDRTRMIDLLFFDELRSWRKQNRILRDHSLRETKVSSKQNAAHVPLE